jgi:DNA-directed RNA polymerase subunit RPC12/RpoP
MPSVSLKVSRAPPGAGEHRSPEIVRPLFRGSGDIDYVCGNCGAVIAASMGPTQRVNVDVATCSACGAENEFPTNLLG